MGVRWSGSPTSPTRRYHAAMSLIRYLFLPLGIVAVGLVYGLLSYEWTGTVLLVVFGGAMAVMGLILLPTLDNVGPTAPVDPDFEDPGR
jgi:hypothetical protein